MATKPVQNGVSEAQKRAKKKYEREHYQRITIQAKKGSRDRIVQAAAATGQSTNGFMRAVLNKAVYDAVGVPMEEKETVKEKGEDQNEEDGVSRN